MHNHDDRYYTEAEVDARLDDKLSRDDHVRMVYINEFNTGICFNIDSTEYIVPRMPAGYSIYRMELVNNLTQLKLYIYHGGQEVVRYISLTA